jgi:uncharacterized protein involved in exopolysaccharide biosynthesis/Mrp family chromosome partitioning ATPase
VVERPTESTAADYASIFRQRFKWIILVLVVVILAAFGYLLVAPKTYASTASVLVTPSIGLNAGNSSTGRTSGDVNLDTEAQIVKSTPVALAAAKLLRSTASPVDLVAQVAVSVPANTTVLSITFSDATPIGAREGAHAFAQGYLDTRKAAAQANVDAQIDSIQAQVTSVNKQLRDVAGRIADAPANSPDRASDEALRSVLSSQLQSLNAQLVPLTTTAVSAGSILTDAQLPSAPVSPDRMLVLGSALALALVLALGVALLVDRLDRRVRRPDDVIATGLDVIVSGLGAARSASLVAPSTRDSALYAELRVPVFASLVGTRGAVLVAPVGGAVGGSVVAANLAASIARTGVATILVSTYPSSVAPRVLGAGEDGPTLASALKGQFAEVRPGRGGMPAVLLAGEDLPHVSDRLQGASMEKLLMRLHEMFDVVVFDVPSLDNDPMGLVLSPVSDSLLFVVEERRTYRAALRDAVHRVRGTGTRVLGAALLSTGPRRNPPTPPPVTNRLSWWTEAAGVRPDADGLPATDARGDAASRH